jgi:acetyltransferase-like isoleucine patch superfamily enzyme
VKLLRTLRSRLQPPCWKPDESAVLHRCGRVVNNRSEPAAVVVGAHTHIKGELLTFAHGGSIQIGAFCFLGEQSRIWSALRIDIGDRVLISHGVNVFDNSTHPLSPTARHEQFRHIVLRGQHPSRIDLDERPVRIEDDVLIGCMSIVLRGVTLGRASVIGAGSVVTADVPPYTIVAGNPARIIRELSVDERG